MQETQPKSQSPQASQCKISPEKVVELESKAVDRLK